MTCRSLARTGVCLLSQHNLSQQILCDNNICLVCSGTQIVNKGYNKFIDFHRFKFISSLYWNGNKFELAMQKHLR